MQSLWMLASSLSFAVMAVFVKLGADEFSTAELVFYRSVATLAGSWAMLARAGQSVRTRRLGMHVHRGVSGFVSLFMFFHALTILPVATAMTLNYTSPVFLALLLTGLARERPGVRLSATVLLGFVGAVLLLRPVFAGDQLFPGLVGLGSGAVAAIAYWNVRELVQQDEPEARVVFYFALFSMLGALVWMLPARWTPLPLDNVWILLGVGVMGTLGQVTLTRAYGHGSPLAAAALSYSGIVFSSVIAMVVFDDALPWLAWLGIALIVAAGIIAVQLTPSSRAEPPPQITND
jgi:drug/metabolite transporter (DMT)-like permease